MDSKSSKRSDTMRVIENEIREAKQDRQGRTGVTIPDRELAELIVCALEEHGMLL